MNEVTIKIAGNEIDEMVEILQTIIPKLSTSRDNTQRMEAVAKEIAISANAIQNRTSKEVEWTMPRENAACLMINMLSMCKLWMQNRDEEPKGFDFFAMTRQLIPKFIHEPDFRHRIETERKRSPELFEKLKLTEFEQLSDNADPTKGTCYFYGLSPTRTVV